MSKRVQIRKIVSTDFLPLIYNYLNSIGLDSVAKKLQKKSSLDLHQSKSPLASKKFKSIAKFYVTNHKHMIQKFIIKQDQSSEEQEVEAEENFHNERYQRKKKLNKKRKPNKKQKYFDEIDQSEQESGNETPVIKKAKKNRKQKQILSENEDEQIQFESEEEQVLQSGQRKYFQKCDDSKLKYLRPEQQDFTHEAKKKFGSVGDTFGDTGNEQLKDIRGKDFRKGKDKLKNKSFCGGNAQININKINSIPL